MYSYRLSTYNIYVDLTVNSEYVLLIHGVTGEYLKIRKTELDIIKDLKYFKTINNSLISKDKTYTISSEILKALKQKGFITYKPKEVEEELFCKKVENLHGSALTKPPAFLFLLSYDCNFNCYYCYQNKIRKKIDPKKIKHRFSKELVDTIYNFINAQDNRSIENIKNRNKEITLYGGEPLLKENKQIIKYLFSKFAQTEKFNYKYFIITNGYNLDDYLDILNSKLISAIQVTLDGIEDMHNNRRMLKIEKNNSFEKVYNNILLVLKKEINIYLRLNVDQSNIKSIFKLLDKLESDGFTKKKNLTIYIDVIELTGNVTQKNHQYNLQEVYNDIKKYSNEKDYKIITHSELYIEKMADSFIKNKSLRKFHNTSFCNAHENQFVLDPFENIYPCYEMDLNANEAIAKLSGNGQILFNEKQKKVWYNRHVASNQKCKKCAYALYCGGGCAKRAEEKNGTIYSNYCNGFKEFFNNKIAEVYENKEKYAKKINAYEK